MDKIYNSLYIQLLLLNSNSMRRFTIVLLLIILFSTNLCAQDLSGYIESQVTKVDTITTVNPDKKVGYTKWYALNNNVLKPLIPYRYDWAELFSQGRATVKNNGKYGVIDHSGNAVVPEKYDFISDYSEGFAVVLDKGKYGLIDSNGKLVVPIEYDFINRLISKKNTMSAVKNGKWGLITIQNKVLVPFNFSYSRVDENGSFLGVDENIKFHNFSPVGTPLVLEGMKTFTEIAPGIYEVKNSEGLTGILNEKMEILLPFEKQSLEKLSAKSTMVVVRQKRLSGLYNYALKKFILPIQSLSIYDNDDSTIFTATEKRSTDNENGIYRFYDAKGNQLFNRTFQDASTFDSEILGIAKVKYDDRWQFIDTSGKPLLPQGTYNENDITVEHRGEGIISAKTENGYGVINSKGKTLIPFEYYSSLNGNPFGFWHSSTYYIIRKDEKVALITKDGKMEIPFGKYEDIKLEHTEPIKGAYFQYAFLKKSNGKWGAIDLATKEEVLPFEYDLGSAQLDSSKSNSEYVLYIRGVKKGNSLDGLYIVKDKKLFLSKDFDYIRYYAGIEGFHIAKNCGMMCPSNGIADKNGKAVTDLSYKEVLDQPDCFFVQRDKKVGFLDGNGKEVIPVTFDVLTDANGSELLSFYHNGYSSLKKGNRNHLVAKGGKIINTDKLKLPADATFDMAEFGKLKVLAGYTEGTLKFIVNEILYEAGANLTMMAERISSPKKIDYASFTFHDGLIAAKKDGLYGYLDYDGKEVIPFIYEMASEFTYYGYAYVKKSDDVFLIDRYGNRMPMLDLQAGIFNENERKKNK
ncbi:WG repeat-containing protein (plasmid) [Chryseobacterium balustinum]|uniref:WG containing repeat-containing protein n=2 Tax=Chryseobacterium balustinum TaxID=246 RepID=A0ABY1LBG3_9FLAO|nr:WG repeat-containing protein [Chryseobacterium balustinum]SKB93974.1 WG containing repeat-containing protein [Chryseobacterium balustinum]